MALLSTGATVPLLVVGAAPNTLFAKRLLAEDTLLVLRRGSAQLPPVPLLSSVLSPTTGGAEDPAESALVSAACTGF